MTAATNVLKCWTQTYHLKLQHIPKNAITLPIWNILPFSMDNQTPVRDVMQPTSNQLVNEERPTRLWLTAHPNQNKEHHWCQHPGSVTCNHGNQHSITFNRRQTLVGKSWLWLTQLHNYCPIIVTRVIGQPKLESGRPRKMPTTHFSLCGHQ